MKDCPTIIANLTYDSFHNVDQVSWFMNIFYKDETFSQGLQVLVKILKAINEDSPAVPALLTDYILKVLCPS